MSRLRQEVSPGIVDEVEIRLIRASPTPIRENLGSLGELAASISEKGLLEPIVVRPLEDKFEIVAGNRRLAACKSLGMRKVICHILSFNEKEAYEAALIENVQHRTLNAVEEARAFKKYVDDYGYGGVSELARKIGKSEQYVSLRLRLLTLPDRVLKDVTSRLVTPSQASELLGLDEQEQAALSDFVTRNRVPAKTVRRLAKEIKSYEDPFSALGISGADTRHIQRVLKKIILLLKTTMIRLDEIIKTLDDNDWVTRDVLVTNRTAIHDQIDRLIKLRIKLNRDEYVNAL